MYRNISQTPVIQRGLRLPRQKPGLSEKSSVIALPVPKRLRMPLVGYHKEILTPSIEIGETVRLGQSLTLSPDQPVIAPASGTVSEISEKPFIHPSGLSVACIDIMVDADADNQEAQKVYDPLTTLTGERLVQCGIVGLGGAGFSTAEKLSGFAINTLVINAVECEPLISCDETLMISDAEGVIQAVISMIEFTRCKRCVIAIENDKLKAIQALTVALDTAVQEQAKGIELLPLAPVYPSGAERPLIRLVTGVDIPYPARPIEKGIVCLNVATVHASWRALSGYPLVSRIITITGSGAVNPCNVRVRLGASVADVLQQSGNRPDDMTRVRAGGPLSGFDLHDIDVPVSATTNCIALEPTRQRSESQPCIRCGQCSEVCPAGLLPQQLYWHSHSEDTKAVLRYGLDSCIECGCCDVVCPSSIALTEMFRHAKSKQVESLRQETIAAQTRARYEKREQRLLAQKNRKAQRRQEAQQKLSDGPDAIAQALKRARNRKRVSKPEQGS